MSDCVKVRFIIKPSGADGNDPSIEQVKNALFNKKIQHAQLLQDIALERPQLPDAEPTA